MGIYDRDYYRREETGFFALAGRGQVCKWLIGINVGVFILQIITKQAPRVVMDGTPGLGSLTDSLLLNTDAALHGQVWRLLTYAFLHDPGSLWHILFNMLFLWWFGADLEEMRGPREFLAFYLTAAFAGGLAYAGWQWIEGEPGRALGASGAVTAVMVLAACYFPSRTILVWFVLPLPIWAFVAFQVIQDSYLFLGGIRTGTAVTCHLGGAAFGFLYYKMQWRLLDLWSDLRSRMSRRSRTRLRIYRGEEEPSRPASSAASSSFDEQLEAKLDAVLEKMASFGKDSLTPDEQSILLRASEIYKRRRT